MNYTTRIPETTPAEKAFSSRGLDWELAARLGAEYTPGKFLFTYKKGGKFLFRKIRTDDKRFWIEPAGAALQFWGLDEVPVLSDRPAEPLIITEGEPDRIACIQAGAKYVLSVPNGTSGRRTDGVKLVSEDNAFAYLWGKDERIIPEVDQFNKIILFTDSDDPGCVLRDELSMRLGAARCWFIPYPEGHAAKDANDILRMYGAEVLQRAIAAAKPMRPSRLVKLSEIPPRQFTQVYDTGWEWLDPHMKLVRPQLMVVTGIPGHGKGAWTRALCSQLAHKHGMRSAFLVPEDPAHRVKRDARRFALHKFSTPGKYDMEAADRFLGEYFHISVPEEDDSLNMEYVEAEMAAAALHHNCQIFVLDPWNEITHDMGRLTETQYIEQAVVRLKRLARLYKMILIIAAHPRKVPPGTEPDLYTINGSATWKNKCDHGVVIHRMTRSDGSLSDKASIIVEKCKDHETMGVPGRVMARLDRMRFDYMKVDDPDDEAPPEPVRPVDDGIPF
jgi:twinkle protein